MIRKGIKTNEIRKSCHKGKDWSGKIKLYCSKDMKSFNLIPKEFQEKYRKHLGKVGMEFVADTITCADIRVIENDPYVLESERNAYLDALYSACLTEEETENYAEGKDLYFYHISDLKVYDKPKVLTNYNTENKKCTKCKCLSCKGCEFENTSFYNPLTKAPQSYCYIQGEVTDERS